MKKLLPLIMLFVGLSAFAQNFQVPSYKFEKDADYAKYNNEILQCIAWLETRPTDVTKKNEATQFFIQWLTGTPDVSVELLPGIIKFSQDNSDLLMAFMYGWTRYSLENPKDTDAVRLNTAGLKSAIKMYRNSDMKDAGADVLAKLEEENGLEKWVKEQLKSK